MLSISNLLGHVKNAKRLNQKTVILPVSNKNYITSLALTFEGFVEMFSVNPDNRALTVRVCKNSQDLYATTYTKKNQHSLIVKDSRKSDGFLNVLMVTHANKRRIFNKIVFLR
jgi:ribosomal protein S8